MGAAFLAVGLLLAAAATLMSEAGGTFTDQTLVGGNTFATAGYFLEGAIVRRVPLPFDAGMSDTADAFWADAVQVKSVPP
jgi:hypothetical protein